MDKISKNRILLQFHITGRCNLRCKHCYREEGDVQPLSFEDVEKVINQFSDLRKKYNKVHEIRKRGHINITGGEPFIREDIKDILKLLGSKSREFTYGILSNGSFIDEETVKILKDTNVSFIQLSIDGDESTHDSLRAKGDFKRVFEKARFLEKRGIRTYISFTANKENYMHLPYVASLCRKYNITKLWSDRIVPIGGGSRMDELAIDDKIFPDYAKTLNKAKGNFLTKLLRRKTEVTSNRALQFLYSEGCYYSCSAGDSLITVDEFGNILPCRRMPINCGNISETTLEEVYFNNETFVNLRKPYIPGECKLCEYQYVCGGGAKCQSYAKYGTYLKADPACPQKNNYFQENFYEKRK